MFSEYKKPIITIDTGLAEGIYAASANTTCNVSGNSVIVTYSGWAPSSPVNITVVVNSGLSSLKLTGYTYTAE